MISWMLMVVTAGAIMIDDVKLTPMTEVQCKTAVKQLAPLKGKMAAVCVGPDGQSFGFEDIE
ncbi:hypothetical protein [Paenochrobactrum sp. BZR 201-1]